MAQKHSATIPTPPTASLKSTASEQEKAAELRALFITMGIQMSWQLAVVVIVPIVGGYFIDGSAHTTPWFTLTGLVLAMAGVIVVLRRVLVESDRRAGNTSAKDAS